MAKLGVGPFTSISGHFFANNINSFHKIEVLMVILRCLMGLNLKFFKYDSWFSSEVRKFTSVRNMLDLSLKY